MNNDKIKIIIDTDVGDDVDDSFAIALGLKSPSLDIIGITTVFKNAFIRAKIVKAELKAFNKTGIDVVAGLDNPLVVPPSIFKYETIGEDNKPIMTAYDDSYIDGADRFDAPNYLLEKARQYPHEITLVAIGPLTNLAQAIKNNPDDFKLFKEIVMMGGSNSNVREWNIVCDPHAADIVLHSGVPIRMIPIECTKLCIVNDNHYAKLLNPSNEEQLFLLDMYQRWRKDQTRPCQMHDCLALQELVSSYCQLEQKHLEVSLVKEDSGRMSAIDDNKYNASIAMSVDATGFMDYLFNTL